MKFLRQQVLCCSRRRTPRVFFLSMIMFACLAAAGCDGENILSDGDGGGGVDTDPPSAVSGPSVAFSQNAPLAAVLSLTSDEPTEVEVDVTGSAAETNSVSPRAEDFSVHSDGFDTVHAITLLGFHPDSPYNIHVTLRDQSGNETELSDIGVVTDPLPEGFPPIQVLTSVPELMEPGVTLFPVNGRGKNGGFHSLIAVDEHGEVVWYTKPSDVLFDDVRRISNGNIIYIDDAGHFEIGEIDMLGNVVRRWFASTAEPANPGDIVVDTERFHHEIFEMQNGNFLVLSVELRNVDDYPTSDSDPNAPHETAAVAADTIVEFSPVDGTIVNEWRLLDMLDPHRIAYDSLGGFWDAEFPEIEGGTRDWAHANAVIHDPSDDSIIVSLRHQDAVVKFSRQTGQIIWILGPHDNWDLAKFGSFLLNPVGDNFLFQYHQHAPEVTESGTILLFDNGNFKASPFATKLTAPENFTRAVEFSINEETKEVSQVWEYGQFIEPVIYAPFVGDANSLPLTGNVLIAFMGIIKDESGLASDFVGGGECSIRIIEVTHTTPAEKVFDLSIEDSSTNVADGWQGYRAVKLPSLYP